MNRRNFLASLGAVMAACGLPAVAAELVKYSQQRVVQETDLLGELSIVFHYDDGIVSEPLPVSVEANLLKITGMIAKSGTLHAVSLYIGDDLAVSANLVERCSVVAGNTALLNWPVRIS